ncbi:MAG: ATP-binding protein [Planctomycetota bacterium]
MNDNQIDSKQLEKNAASRFLSHAERLSEFGCFEWDMVTNHVRWSDGLYRIYGLEPQEFEATLEAFLERVVPEDRPQVQTAVQKAIETCGSFCGVERIRHSSGEIRNLESRGEVQVDDDGKPVRLIGVCHDVTKTKQLEDQLRLSQKMEAVGQLAAGVAHDFNNLLTVITVNSDLLLLNTASNPTAARATAAIQDAAERASSLTSQLLMFGRKAKPNIQVVDLNAKIRQSRDLFDSVVGEQVSVQFQLEPAEQLVQIDPTHLDQVLVNLVVNGRDAMPDGGTLVIKTARMSDWEESDVKTASSGARLRLSVSDNGEGMDTHRRDHAFDPFFTTKPAGKGTGLGLAVVYGVVQAAGGKIEIVSEVGKGTEVLIDLPIAESKATEETPKVVSVEGERKRVLLVEDQAPVREATSAALQSVGFDVVECDSGRRALELLEPAETVFDLLITDVIMPEMDGYALAEQATNMRPELAVLCITGFANSERGTSGHLHLYKPYSVAELVSKVHEVLRIESSSEEHVGS